MCSFNCYGKLCVSKFFSIVKTISLALLVKNCMIKVGWVSRLGCNIVPRSLGKVNNHDAEGLNSTKTWSKIL